MAKNKNKKDKRKFGDRKDAKLIRDIDELHIAMSHCYPRRTDNEAYISVTAETAPIKEWIAKHPDTEFKYTIFHFVSATILKTLIIRPKLNRFICNKKYYQKNDREIGFIVKRQFKDDATEGMATVLADESSTIYSVHKSLKEQIFPVKSGKNNSSQTGLAFLKKLPYWILKIVFFFIRHWSETGHLPKSATDGDSNHCSAFITNLGSIGLKCGYHHLMNYGTNSIFIIIGETRMKPFYDNDGKVTMKEVVDLGITIDERIADGYYYAKTVKIIKKLLENPNLLELPFETEIEL